MVGSMDVKTFNALALRLGLEHKWNSCIGLDLPDFLVALRICARLSPGGVFVRIIMRYFNSFQGMLLLVLHLVKMFIQSSIPLS